MANGHVVEVKFLFEKKKKKVIRFYLDLILSTRILSIFSVFLKWLRTHV